MSKEYGNPSKTNPMGTPGHKKSEHCERRHGNALASFDNWAALCAEAKERNPRSFCFLESPKENAIWGRSRVEDWRFAHRAVDVYAVWKSRQNFSTRVDSVEVEPGEDGPHQT